ncbi:gamma-butyrobetaine dioxygenase [Kiloniella laminariae]|uniref:Gamma-butyrobetaine dioxygenase n=1 Tax=Kiloniella laminariae TaxID=454162 RepID=A0ABT4LHX1_9PROT|nr:gamma-butyrobetaine dioxygenase [Kiloniella laminariae]MCZ4280699.1 gamma-butyrobetaine dioxygenase [Kiloniella laminariae]
MSLETAGLLQDGEAVCLQWSDGKTARFHAIWLRDNAQDPETRASGNGQRLITILDIPANTRLASAEIKAGDQLHLRMTPENKELVFSGNWLRKRIYDTPAVTDRGWCPKHITTWDAGLNASVPTVDLNQAKADRTSLANWLEGVRRYGLAIMTGLSTDSGSLCEVAELFGYIRETNYGRWFEVRSEINPVNLAYTGLGLQAHTDNPYRDPVPTLQLLACLENSADGGESMVVDGFKAAQVLRQESPESFDLLARFPVRFEYAGADDIRLRAKRPMIELGPDGELIAIRFNNRSSAPYTDIPFESMADYYRAYRKLAEIIERPEMEVTFKMKAGDLFIVDNTRVLHARKGFSGAGTRWLQGCYADKDGLLSTLAALEEKMQEAAE